MGLDVIELIMEIEDEFSVKIPDEEACQAVTVEKLHQCVLDKVEISTEQRCSTQKAFYVLRKALKENLDIDGKIIKPQTKTELLFPKSELRELWSKMTASMPYKYPELIYPHSFGIIIVLASLIAIGSCIYLLSQYLMKTDNTIMCFIIVCLWIPLTILLCKLIFNSLVSFKTVVPNGCNTLGGIAKYISFHNTEYFGALNKKEIWDKLTYIISEQLGVDQEEIKPESNFVEDFNI